MRISAEPSGAPDRGLDSRRWGGRRSPALTQGLLKDVRRVQGADSADACDIVALLAHLARLDTSPRESPRDLAQPDGRNVYSLSRGTS